MPAVDPEQRSNAQGQPFRVAVAGEFNSGKSSLINLLLRRDALPVGVNWSRQPPVEIALSEGISLLEVPIDETGHLGPEARGAIEAADMLIWCTMAQRAWCLSETDLVATLPERIFRNSVIAVTRSDLLDPAARELVRARVCELTADRFAGLVMVDADAETLARAGDAEVWGASGGKALVDAIEAAAAAPPPPVLVLRGVEQVPEPTENPWPDLLCRIETMVSEAAPEGRVWEAVRVHLDRPDCTAPLFARARHVLDQLKDAPDRDLWALDLAIEINDRLLPSIQSGDDPSLRRATS